MTKLSIYFPKQKNDYKLANRSIRANPIFKTFVTGKSKDRRYLHFDFQEESKYNVLKPILFETLKTTGYEFNEVTNSVKQPV